MTCVNSLEATTNMYQYYVYRDKYNSAGKVVAIVEEPQTAREDKV